MREHREMEVFYLKCEIVECACWYVYVCVCVEGLTGTLILLRVMGGAAAVSMELPANR